MAKKFKKIGKISETENSGFGEYSEANGGGSPKGGSWGGRSGRVGWQNRIDSGEVKDGESRQDQPRTSDGKFTYNSVNGKETKYESRGKTVNPLLTGGENGIKIEDVKKEFSAKSGSLYNRFKGNFYEKKSMKVTKEGKKYTIKISSDDIWEIARGTWDVSKGELKGESEVWSETKKGAPGKQGAAAKAYAKKTNSEQYVKNERGEIAKKGENAMANMAKALKTSKSDSQLIHSPAQIKQVRDMAAAEGYDFSQFTDEQIDQLVDQFFTVS